MGRTGALSVWSRRLMVPSSLKRFIFNARRSKARISDHNAPIWPGQALKPGHVVEWLGKGGDAHGGDARRVGGGAGRNGARARQPPALYDAGPETEAQGPGIGRENGREQGEERGGRDG